MGSRRCAALVVVAAVAASCDRLADAASDSAALPSDEAAFSFDGTTSDIAQQLYWRAMAGDTMPPITLDRIPPAIAERVDRLDLDFNRDLPGLLQRAVLWDSGFVTTEGGSTALQVWTLSGSMTDLALSYNDYIGVGCVPLECNGTALPTYYSSQFCNGRQILSGAKCLVQTFESAGEGNFAMWSDGGDPDLLPEFHVIDHSWVDNYAKLSYKVYAIHSLPSDSEPLYGTCSTSGYGSLVIPCYPSSIANESMQEVSPSPWVTTWLEAYQASSGKGSPPSNFDELLLVLLLAAAVLIGIVMVMLYRRSRYHRRLPVHLQSSHGMQSDHEQSFDDTLGPYKMMMTTPTGTIDEFASNNSRPTLSTGDSSLSIWSMPSYVDQTLDTHRAYTSEDSDGYGPNTLYNSLTSDANLVGKRIRYSQIQFVSVLSKGAFGEVWLCELGGDQVAAKRLKQNKEVKFAHIQDFIHEIQISASLEHPNIVRVIGVAWDTLFNLCMVIEFLPRGDLRSYLNKHGDLLTWGRDKIHIAIGIARGIDYLHSREPVLIHRDLKSKNVLLNWTLDPQLSDFGVSRRRMEETMTAGVGTPYWTAPEVLSGERYTEQSDIYSFGVLLTELDTCKMPFYDFEASVEVKVRPIQIMNGVMSGELRPSFSDECPERIRQLGLRCLEQDPAGRPTAQEILQILDW